MCRSIWTDRGGIISERAENSREIVVYFSALWNIFLLPSTGHSCSLTVKEKES